MDLVAEGDLPVSDSYKELLIINKYRKFQNYIYPMTTNWSNKHHVFRDAFLQVMFDQIKLFHDAGKTNQISKLYLADAGLSTLREFLEFATNPQRRLITPHQCATAQTLLAEVGRILGEWIKKVKPNKYQKGEKR